MSTPFVRHSLREHKVTVGTPLGIGKYGLQKAPNLGLIGRLPSTGHRNGQGRHRLESLKVPPREE